MAWVLLTIPPPGPEQYPDLDPGGLPLPVIIPNDDKEALTGQQQQ